MPVKKEKYDIIGILPLSIGGRLTMSSIFTGFVNLGHNLIIFDELNRPIEELLNLFDEKNYDFILGYDFSALKIKIDHALDINCINYFSDVIEDDHSGSDWREYYKFLNDSDNYTFYWDKKLCESQKKQIKNIFYLPHFVNTDIYANLGFEPEYDVMFAGRLDTDFRLDTTIRLMQKFEEQGFAWYAIRKHFDDAISRRPEHECLIRKCYRGFIDTEKKMAIAINKAKIVFNFNQQGVGSLNYRTFQTMACERLLLSDYRREVDDLFTQGENIICYSNIDDLESKIKFYLENETERQKIAKASRAFVVEKYSSNIGVQKMIEMIEY